MSTRNIVSIFKETHDANISATLVFNITQAVIAQAIRKTIYTTNAIESLNLVLRESIKNRNIFNHADSAFKVVFLAIKANSKKWTMLIRNWSSAMNQFIILQEDRLKDYV